MRVAWLHELSPTATLVGERLRSSGHEVHEIAGTGEETGDAELIEALTPFGPDLLLVTAWSRRLGPSVIGTARVDAVNVHPSLLPALRGPNPEFWAIRRRLPSTGVTVHRLVHAFDAGEIVVASTVPIGPTTTLGDLCEVMAPVAWGLLEPLLAVWSRGERPPGTPQGEGASRAPLVRYETLRVAWTEPAEDIAALARACAPRMWAVATYAGKELAIHEATAEVGELAPARVNLRGSVARIGTGRGVIALGRVTWDGRTGSAADLLRDGDALG